MAKKPTMIQKIVYDILCEDTFISLCDSGGYAKYDENGKYIGSEQGYGRAYERNRSRSIEDFINEPSLQYNITSWGVEKYMPIFHYICDNFEVDNICKSFNKLNLQLGDCVEDFDNKYYVKFYKWLEKIANKYNGREPITVSREYNTYNGDSDVSQTYQWFDLMFGEEWYDRDNYIAIAVHQGCDVRGGYAKYRLFKYTDNYPDVYIDRDRMEEDFKYGYGTWYLNNEILSEEDYKVAELIYENTNSFDAVFKIMMARDTEKYESVVLEIDKIMMDKNPNQLKLV